MKFLYKAQSKDGVLTTGERESVDTFSLARDLRKEGLMPFSITRVRERPFLSSSIHFFQTVSLPEKIIFTNNLSGMLTAGISLVRALTVLEKQSKNTAFKKVLQDMYEDINRGSTFSEAVARHPRIFSPLFVAMIRAGEESGSLPATLSEIGITLKKGYELHRKIKSALMYPSIIICAIIIIGILMMMFVVPTLTQTFKDLGSELPSSTKAIVWISDMLSQNTVLFFSGVAVFIGVLFLIFRIPRVSASVMSLLLRVPHIGVLIQEVYTARTARTLSSLLSSGVSLSRSLEITAQVLSVLPYRKNIEHAIVRIEKGMLLSESFKERADLYPLMVGEMIEVGEESGMLSKMLLDIAIFYEAEVDAKTKDIATIIEPVLMIIVGVAVGFFALSMISPIYSVMDTIS